MNKTVQILVDNRPVPQFFHNGKTYIEARVGTEYSVKVKNDSCSRKMVVLTIDGVNCLDGLPQGDSIGQGYIVNAYDSIDIKGFRKDQNTVGAFKFCKANAAYCNEKGLKGNNGVIGVRVYDEKVNYTVTTKRPEPFPLNPPWNEPWKPYRWQEPYITWTYNDNTLRSASNSIDSQNNGGGTCNCSSMFVSSNPAPEFSVGSSWGQALNDSVTYVTFEPSDNYQETIIYYDTRRNLEKIGISFKKEKQVFFPQAFGGFAKPPSGWRG